MNSIYENNSERTKLNRIAGRPKCRFRGYYITTQNQMLIIPKTEWARTKSDHTHTHTHSETCRRAQQINKKATKHRRNCKKALANGSLCYVQEQQRNEYIGLYTLVVPLPSRLPHATRPCSSFGERSAKKFTSRINKKKYKKKYGVAYNLIGSKCVRGSLHSNKNKTTKKRNKTAAAIEKTLSWHSIIKNVRIRTLR